KISKSCETQQQTMLAHLSRLCLASRPDQPVFEESPLHPLDPLDPNFPLDPESPCPPDVPLSLPPPHDPPSLPPPHDPPSPSSPNDPPSPPFLPHDPPSPLPPPHDSPTPRGFILDGANALHYPGTNRTPQVACLLALIDHLGKKYYNSKCYVICSSSCQQYVESNDRLKVMWRKHKLAVLPRQCDDDLALLRYAAEHDMVVVSNDRYRKYLEDRYRDCGLVNDAMRETIKERVFSYTYLDGLGADVQPDSRGPGCPILQAVVNRQELDSRLCVPVNSKQHSRPGSFQCASRLTYSDSTKATKTKAPKDLPALLSDLRKH
ncbi:hypothetical protein BOX15_Mlig025582g1, partial [Macrostomum lignano]